MGISYPYMAILSIVFFTVTVTGVLFAYLYIVDQANRAPMIGVYAEANIQGNKMIITITARHMRGEIVQILSIHIYGENRLDILIKDNGCFSREDPSVDCHLIGFTNSRLLQGSTGKILITLFSRNPYFHEGKIYRGIIMLDHGTYSIAFIPLNTTSLGL